MKFPLNLIAFLIPVLSFGQAPSVTEKPLSEDDVFIVVEKMPQFPGGQDSLTAYIGRNIKYTKEALDSNVSGKVYVSFIVSKTGVLKDFNVLKGIGYGLDEECIRVLKAMPDWSPGILNGKKVNVKMTIPIKFSPSK